MLRFLRRMSINFSVAREMLEFLWERRLWWLIPMVTLLLILGLFLVFASASGLAPFIYTLF